MTSVTPLLVLTIAGVLAFQFLPRQVGPRLLSWAGEQRPVWQGLGFALTSIPILALAPVTVPAFIYYRF